jgi:hypothetical protein
MRPKKSVANFNIRFSHERQPLTRMVAGLARFYRYLSIYKKTIK